MSAVVVDAGVSAAALVKPTGWDMAWVLAEVGTVLGFAAPLTMDVRSSMLECPAGSWVEVVEVRVHLRDAADAVVVAGELGLVEQPVDARDGYTFRYWGGWAPRVCRVFPVRVVLVAADVTANGGAVSS